MYVLMSIKPKYVEKILSGEKKYEYRKTLLKKDVESILVYSTSPVKKVVCEIKLLEHLSMYTVKLIKKVVLL